MEIKRYCRYKIVEKCGGVEQSVARWAHNPKVAGSNPAPATNGATIACYLFFLNDSSKRHYVNTE